MKLKRIICLILSLLMMSACFAALPAFAYVDTSAEASPNSVYATIAKANITAWSGETTATVENGQYKMVSTGQQRPNFTVKAPQVDASAYLNVVVEISVPAAMSGKKGYVKCIYSDGTEALKGVWYGTHQDGEFVTVTATFDAKTGVTIDKVRFQPYGEETDIATSEDNNCLIRSIKFVKSNTADKVYNNAFASYGSADVTPNVEFDGNTCTKVTSPDGYFGVEMSSVDVSAATYKYAVVEMYVEAPKGESKLGTYPIYQVRATLKTGETSWTWYAFKGLYPGQERYGYDLSAGYRQAFVFDAWQTYVFPLTDNHNGEGVGSDETIQQAYIKFSDYAYSENIYIKSVRYTVEAPEAENITFTPETEGISLSGVTGQETIAKSIFNDKLVWKVGDDSGASGGSVQFSGNISVSTASYSYALVNCYYENSVGSLQTFRLTGSQYGGVSSWYTLWSHDGGASANDMSLNTRSTATHYGNGGAWLTLVFPIIDKNIANTNHNFSASDYITKFVFDAYGDGGKGGNVYISSITFSAKPVATQDKLVSESEDILFRGAQNATSENAIRLIATLKDIDLGDYSKVGFKCVAGGEKSYESTTVYNSIIADGNTVNASDYANGKYIVAIELGTEDSGGNAISGTFTVTPYLTANDGTKVEGISIKITVTNGAVTAWEVA